jgi:hypothetical protein
VLFGLYTKGFRQLSGSVHVAATLFTEDRCGEAMALLDDSLDVSNRVAVRALSAAVLAVVYADVARALIVANSWKDGRRARGVGLATQP